MWLRHKHWQSARALVPLVTVCASGRVYKCSGADKGVVNVPYRADADELLDPSGDRRGEWEVAWDKYGYAFDAQGKVLEAKPASVQSVNTQASDTGQIVSTATTVEAPKRGRPRRS